MKARLNPLEISLKDLPPEGREFTYTRESTELNATLEELIGQNPYRVHFKIMPMGNTYDLRGEVKTGMDLQCALCAIDFKHPIEQKLHELLVVQKRTPMAKGDQQSKANHAHEWEEGGPDYIILEEEIFDVSEYVHEIVALAEPIRPLGTPDCEELSCPNLTGEMKKWIHSGPMTQDPMRANPFRILEKMKLKS